MDRLDDLVTFVLAVKAGGLGRAADRLGISKSVVSRRLDRLERELGVSLLHRTTRGVQPTEAGVAFEKRCSRLLAELENAREEVRGHGGHLSGSLRLAAPVSFGWRHLAPALAQFSARHDRLVLDVSYADRNVDLVAEGFDLAVRIGVPEDSSLIARRIAPIRLVMVASPDYLAERGTPREPADLARHAGLIATRAGSTNAIWRFEVGGRWQAGAPGEVRLRADNGEALMEGAAAGLGLTVLPTFIAADGIGSGKLVPVLPTLPMPEMSLSVLRPPGEVTAKVRALTDDLAARFGPEPHWDACHAARHAMATGTDPQAAAAIG